LPLLASKNILNCHLTLLLIDASIDMSSVS
jgi:hypothetical protein